MPTDPKKRQKKQERRTAKRKEKKHALVRQQHAGLPERLSAAARFPILACWVGARLEDQGIGSVHLSRELPGGQVAVANFLIDRFCLGVKNAWAEIVGRSIYNEKYQRKGRRDMVAQDVAPADARKLVEEAAAYARGLGLSPDPDYAKLLLLFGDVNPADGTARFEFGKDGKPYFVAGPYDTPARCRQILSILTNTCGPDGFHYLLPLGGPERDRYVPVGLDHEDAGLIDSNEEFEDDEG